MTDADTTETTYDMSASPQFISRDYKPLRFKAEPAETWLCRAIAQEILNFLGRKSWNLEQWKKKGFMSLEWERDGRPQRARLRFVDLAQTLATTRAWPSEVPQPPTSWMDDELGVAMNYHAPANQKGAKRPAFTMSLQVPFAHELPVSPQIDREGVAFSSMQTYLQTSILQTRARIVDRSGSIFQLADHQWLHDLVGFLNASISVFEATLHQIYYRAKHPPAGVTWQFDQAKLGSTRKSRTLDKLKWVKAITGNQLNATEKETAAIKGLKHVRNHLNHFDPPAFACTIEDLAEWLSHTHHVAQLLWKIRKCAGVPLSASLISLLLAPRVEFVPHDPGKRRVPQPKCIGYGSVCMPDPDDASEANGD